MAKDKDKDKAKDRIDSNDDLDATDKAAKKQRKKERKAKKEAAAAAGMTSKEIDALLRKAAKERITPEDVDKLLSKTSKSERKKAKKEKKRSKKEALAFATSGTANATGTNTRTDTAEKSAPVAVAPVAVAPVKRVAEGIPSCQFKLRGEAQDPTSPTAAAAVSKQPPLGSNLRDAPSDIYFPDAKRKRNDHVGDNNQGKISKRWKKSMPNPRAQVKSSPPQSQTSVSVFVRNKSSQISHEKFINFLNHSIARSSPGLPLVVSCKNIFKDNTLATKIHCRDEQAADAVMQLDGAHFSPAYPDPLRFFRKEDECFAYSNAESVGDGGTNGNCNIKINKIVNTSGAEPKVTVASVSENVSEAGFKEFILSRARLVGLFPPDVDPIKAMRMYHTKKLKKGRHIVAIEFHTREDAKKILDLDEIPFDGTKLSIRREGHWKEAYEPHETWETLLLKRGMQQQQMQERQESQPAQSVKHQQAHVNLLTRQQDHADEVGTVEFSPSPRGMVYASNEPNNQENLSTVQNGHASIGIPHVQMPLGWQPPVSGAFHMLAQPDHRDLQQWPNQVQVPPSPPPGWSPQHQHNHNRQPTVATMRNTDQIGFIVRPFHDESVPASAAQSCPQSHQSVSGNGVPSHKGRSSVRQNVQDLHPEPPSKPQQTSSPNSGQPIAKNLSELKQLARNRLPDQKTGVQCLQDEASADDQDQSTTIEVTDASDTVASETLSSVNNSNPIVTKRVVSAPPKDIQSVNDVPTRGKVQRPTKFKVKTGKAEISQVSAANDMHIARNDTGGIGNESSDHEDVGSNAKYLEMKANYERVKSDFSRVSMSLVTYVQRQLELNHELEEERSKRKESEKQLETEKKLRMELQKEMSLKEKNWENDIVKLKEELGRRPVTIKMERFEDY